MSEQNIDITSLHCHQLPLDRLLAPGLTPGLTTWPDSVPSETYLDVDVVSTGSGGTASLPATCHRYTDCAVSPRLAADM